MTANGKLVARLQESGDLTDDWRPVFERVPRHWFIPDRIWDPDPDTPGEHIEIDRMAELDRWLERVYTDTPIITQLDDGERTGCGYASSSASKPSIVARMLRELGVEANMHVLEIGTGTGWNAALLCARVGNDNRVTTVEVDPFLAGRARQVLSEAGFNPRVVTGDGMEGYLPCSPYDRVIATAAVQRVPYPWVAGTRPGGIILAPFGTAFHNGTLARLTVNEHGMASGPIGGNVAFMWARSQRTPHGAVEDRVLPDHDYVEHTTLLYPREPVSDFDASFTIGLLVPNMKSTLVFDEDDPSTGRFTVYLMDPGTDSWASWRIDPKMRGQYRIRQHGLRRLFDELEAAHQFWIDAGRPAHTRFGLTVSSTAQTVWLDDPSQVVAIMA